MKRILVLLLALMFLFLTACNAQETNSNTSGSNTTSSESSTDEINDDFKYEEVIPVGNTSNIIEPLKGGFDKEADELRNKILNSKDELEITGTTYYVSYKGNDENDGRSKETAWRSFDGIMLNSYLFEPGDAVLFERDGVYRQSSTWYINSGLTIGAYGEGEKPKIYGSQINYAQPELWEPSNKKFVWKLKLTTLDAGIIVFNHGEAIGSKKDGLLELEKNGDFYHNVNESVFYLYLDQGYPDVVYKDIEIGTKGNMLFIQSNAKDIIIDNLCLKYTGSHAIGTTLNASNIRITNCEIGWIGGSYQDEEKNPDIRYGNGIQFWDSTIDSVVDNNWVYQCYDTGITFQGQGPNSVYKNLKFTNNLVEYCTYSFEYWDTQTEGNVKQDIIMENNISRFAGYGWGPNERPENAYTSHIFFGSTTATDISKFIIKNNIFDLNAYSVIYWSQRNGSEIYDGIKIGENSFYQRPNELNRVCGYNGKYNTANNKTDFIDALKFFDASPKQVIFDTK